MAIAEADHLPHEPHSFMDPKYVWSQDHKVIAVQYGEHGHRGRTDRAAAVQPDAPADRLPGLCSSSSTPERYYQFVTMHGMIMVIYLLTALFLGGFGNYLIPLMVGARDMVFPFVNMLSYWVYLLSVIVLLASFFVPGGPTGAGWTLYPPQAILPKARRGSDWGIILMLVSLVIFIVAFDHGRPELCNHRAAGALPEGMTLMRMPLTVWGIFVATILALLAFPALVRERRDDAAGQDAWAPASSCPPWSRWARPTGLQRRQRRCCSSICSGSSATPRSTSSRCPPSASSRT